MRQSSNDAMVLANVTFMMKVLPFLSIFHGQMKDDENVDLAALQFFVSLRGVSSAWVDAIDNCLALHSVALKNIFSIGQFYRNVFESLKKVYEQDDSSDFRQTEAAIRQSFKITSTSLQDDPVVLPALNSFLDDHYLDDYLYDRGGRCRFGLLSSNASRAFSQLFWKNLKPETDFFKAIGEIVKSEENRYLPVRYFSFFQRTMAYCKAVVFFMLTSLIMVFALPAYFDQIDLAYSGPTKERQSNTSFAQLALMTIWVVLPPLLFKEYMSSVLSHVNFLLRIEKSCQTLNQEASQLGVCDHLSSWAGLFLYKKDKRPVVPAQSLKRPGFSGNYCA